VSEAKKEVIPIHREHCSCSFSAEEVADALIAKLADPKTAESIMDVWGGRVDQQLGKGLRRFGLYVIVGMLSLGAMKLGLFEKLLTGGK